MNKMSPQSRTNHRSMCAVQENPHLGLRLVVILLAALLLFNVFILLIRTSDNGSTYVYQYSEMDRELSRGDIPELRNMVYENISRGVKTMEDTSSFEETVRAFEKEMRGK